MQAAHEILSFQQRRYQLELNLILCETQNPVTTCGALTWLAVAPAAVGDSAPTGLRKRGGLSTGEFRRR